MINKTNLCMIDTMKTLSEAEADAFAREWAAAWNFGLDNSQRVAISDVLQRVFLSAAATIDAD